MIRVSFGNRKIGFRTVSVGFRSFARMAVFSVLGDCFGMHGFDVEEHELQTSAVDGSGSRPSPSLIGPPWGT